MVFDEDNETAIIKSQVSEGLNERNDMRRIYSVEPVARDPDYELVWNIKLINNKGELTTFSLQKPPGSPGSWYKGAAMQKI